MYLYWICSHTTSIHQSRLHPLSNKATIHQLTTILATFKNVTSAWVIFKVSGHQYWWLAGGYDLEIGHF